MANSTIDDQKIALIDNWPGEPNHNLGIPTGGFTGSGHHNVAAAIYPIGTKIQAYDSTSNGYATFIYLQYIIGSSSTLGAKDPVAMDTSEQSTVATTSTWYKVTSDGGEALILGPLAFAISTLTTTYYGWFWCGGVCPVALVSGLGGTYVTDGTIAAGKAFTGGNSTADGNISLIVAPDVSNSTAGVASGYALITD